MSSKEACVFTEYFVCFVLFNSIIYFYLFIIFVQRLRAISRSDLALYKYSIIIIVGMLVMMLVVVEYNCI